jgi:hypothetical protein
MTIDGAAAGIVRAGTGSGTRKELTKFRSRQEEVLGAPGQEAYTTTLDNRKPKHSRTLGIQEQEVSGLSSLRRVMSRLDFATVDVDTAKCAPTPTLPRYASTDQRRNSIL